MKNKNNIYGFSFISYFIRFGLIGLLLIIVSLFIIPFVSPCFILVFILLINIYRKQVITINPFQVERRRIIKPDDLSNNVPFVRINKFFYIENMTDYKVTYTCIIIYGTINYRKCTDWGVYEEKEKRVNQVKILRAIKNEKELLSALSEMKLRNKQN
jgi:hypothetical protein